MAGGKRKPTSPKKLVDELTSCANGPMQEHEDGTLEDEVYVLTLKVAELTGIVNNLDAAIRSQSESLAISRRQNIVAVDVICTLLNIPMEVFDLAYENVAVYETKQVSDLPLHIKSRQKSLVKRLTRVGVIDG